MPRYIYGFLVSMILAYLVTPSVMKLAWKIGAIDKPGDPRRIHKQPMPRLGGLAIYIAFVLTGLLTLPLKQGYIQGIFLGASLIVIVGIVDDIYNLPVMDLVRKNFVPVIAGLTVSTTIAVVFMM